MEDGLVWASRRLLAALALAWSGAVFLVYRPPERWSRALAVREEARLLGR